MFWYVVVCLGFVFGLLFFGGYLGWCCVIVLVWVWQLPFCFCGLAGCWWLGVWVWLLLVSVGLGGYVVVWVLVFYCAIWIWWLTFCLVWCLPFAAGGCLGLICWCTCSDWPCEVLAFACFVVWFD